MKLWNSSHESETPNKTVEFQDFQDVCSWGFKIDDRPPRCDLNIDKLLSALALPNTLYSNTVLKSEASIAS